GAAGGKDPIRVFHADDFVKLHEIDMVGLQPLQGFVYLPRCGCFGPAINLGHEKDLLAVTVEQRFAHADFTAAVVVVPGVVHEVYPAIDGGADDAEALLLVFWLSDMITAKADCR